MNRRRPNKAIDHNEARRLTTAKHEAARRRFPLTMFLTIHPNYLTDPPDDVGLFTRSVVKKLGQWFRNNRSPWFGIWVRENYDAQGREHLHLLIHVPRHLRAKLRAALARWWPEDHVADLKEVEDDDDTLNYMLKQMTPQAAYALHFRVRRERRSRHDLAKVAAVLGSRVGMTSNLAGIVRALENPLKARKGSPQTPRSRTLNPVRRRSPAMSIILTSTSPPAAASSKFQLRRAPCRRCAVIHRNLCWSSLTLRGRWSWLRSDGPEGQDETTRDAVANLKRALSRRASVPGMRR